eukprot:TRINITY_DN274_c0_g1_i2.p1 TRINITY_DN274_c0_g1~~TRINITY_DN274_c0_g1_i2.p1  ORF type:complete len:443 (+),score=73.55 TRINITY_DN274_c0_g1_i2:108-1331(+)
MVGMGQNSSSFPSPPPSPLPLLSILLHSHSHSHSQSPSSSPTTSTTPSLPLQQKQKQRMGNRGGRKEDARAVYRTLVLGNSQTGKSTFFKQLRLLNSAEDTEAKARSNEVAAPAVRSEPVHTYSLSSLNSRIGDADKTTLYGPVLATLRSNLILAYKELFADLVVPSASSSTGAPNFSSRSRLRPSRRRRKLRAFVQGEGAEAVRHFVEKNPFEPYDPKTAEWARWLWQQTIVRTAYNHNRMACLGATVHLAYIMENLDRIADETAAPNAEDYLLARARTTGSYAFTYVMPFADYEFIDVGGQRSERRHWTQVIDSPQLIVFFASLIEYDIPTVANPQKTKLEESLSIWEEMLRVREFGEAKIMLILNHADLLAQKIDKAPYTVLLHYRPNIASIPVLGQLCDSTGV